jgi:hypothetical protein
MATPGRTPQRKTSVSDWLIYMLPGIIRNAVASNCVQAVFASPWRILRQSPFLSLPWGVSLWALLMVAILFVPVAFVVAILLPFLVLLWICAIALVRLVEILWRFAGRFAN